MKKKKKGKRRRRRRRRKRQCPGKKKKKKRKKKKRRKRQTFRPKNKIRKKKILKRKVLDEAHVQVHMGILVIYLSNSSHLVFSPFWKENFLVGFGRKHLNPTIIFLSALPYQTLSKKFSPHSLSLSLSLILPKIHFTKHTLKVAVLWTWL